MSLNKCLSLMTCFSIASLLVGSGTVSVAVASDATYSLTIFARWAGKLSRIKNKELLPFIKIVSISINNSALIAPW
jgi:hypothetical protein